MKAAKLLSFILLLGLIACTPQSGGGGKARSGARSNTTTSVATPVATVNANGLFWYAALTQTSTIIVDSNTQTNIFLRGSETETYLASSTHTTDKYCLVANFAGTTLGQYRSRVVPIPYNSPSGVEWVFQVELAEEAHAQSTCGGTVDSVAAGASAYKLGDICPTCSSNLTATDVRIYESDGTSATTLIPLTGSLSLSMSSMVFRVNPSNNSNTTIGSCSNTSCQANGFGCCLDGQCVNDGQTKPTALALTAADSDYIEYLTSQSDISSNSGAYSNYPQFYYVCGNATAPTPTPTATTDQTAASNAAFLNLANQYLCLLCDPANGSDPTNTQCAGITLASGASTSYAACTYNTIMEEVIAECGCQDSTVANCPGYNLQAVVNDSSVVTDIACVYPTPNVDPTPFQNLTVNLETRAAPHRFFKTSDGTSVDDITSIFGSTTVTPEGTEFEYFDPSSKVLPNNGSYNMNSVIGQFDTDLSQAYPAKVINLDAFDDYIIQTTSGYYSYCPTCASDPWFSLFRAFPSSQSGTGLQGIGHSTSRDSGAYNYGSGSYADTKFGRACFLPPTMIPFSHKAEATVQTQRANRLATQAAYFVNGYQRDWFGFNRGAVIGSFDGVKWFAIGKGRKVQATSNKLFIAINAPFADLAELSTVNVQVIKDLSGSNVISDFDYDQNLSWNSPEQNEAASCQKHHQCNTDSDCVTQLGWEYSCATVTRFKTLWPRFDVDANEIANQSHTYNTVQMLQGQQLPSGSLKRCVYRGAGAPCRRNYTSWSTDSLTNTAQNYSCAPNFYCADISGANFNSEVARYGNTLDNLINMINHRYGMDADILGRPLHYMGNAQTLTASIQANMTANASIFSTTDFNTNMGICMPGKDNEQATQLARHQNGGSTENADYISQIGNCESGDVHDDTAGSVLTAGSQRLISCPAFGSDGNYISRDPATDPATDPPLSISPTLQLIRSQNSCGGESQTTAGASAFSDIESDTLATLNGASTSIVNPTLVQNACLRRAGAVCHTDLDCGPNKFHAAAAGTRDDTYFGDSTAERAVFEEYLVCGQADPKPYLGLATFDDYDIKQNRCCREIGKDITLYTKQSGSTDTAISGMVIMPNANVVSNSTQYRYTRYTSVDNIGSTSFPKPEVDNDASPSLPSDYQWKTISETAKQTCCGGGYIRKFADGTHDWTQTNRLSVDIANFQCLNYSNSLITDKPADVPQSRYDVEYNLLCQNPDLTDPDHGCLQVSYSASSGSKPPVNATTVGNGPILASPSFLEYGSITDTLARSWGGGSWLVGDKNLILYPPLMADVSNPFLDQPYFEIGSSSNTLQMYLPIFINDSASTGNTRGIGLVYIVSPDSTNFTPPILFGRIPCTEDTIGALDTEPCSWRVDSTTGQFDLWLGATYNNTTDQAIVQIEYATPDLGSKPGNPKFYLERLSKLELLGVPQIHHEPLYCNTDNDQLIPDLYNVGTTRAAFNAAGGTDASLIMSVNGAADAYYNPAGNFVLNNKINHDPIFSEEVFTCCTELGNSATSAAQCCSNFAVDDGDGNLECKLPVGADLNVYFNPFISSEGMRDHGDVTFSDSDFDPKSGDPIDGVASKLITLGARYCENGLTRDGAAFGNFNGQPTPSAGYFGSDFTIYSIIDSYSDNDNVDPTQAIFGAFPYSQGFRWNNHIYCAPATGSGGGVGI